MLITLECKINYQGGIHINAREELHYSRERDTQAQLAWVYQAGDILFFMFVLQWPPEGNV